MASKPAPEPNIPKDKGPPVEPSTAFPPSKGPPAAPLPPVEAE